MPLEQQAAEPRAAPGGPLSHGGYSRKQILIFTYCVLSLLVLGWVDYATGYELGFFIVSDGTGTESLWPGATRM